MILFGINFNAYFLILIRKFRQAWESEEVRAYLLIIAAASLRSPSRTRIFQQLCTGIPADDFPGCFHHYNNRLCHNKL